MRARLPVGAAFAITIVAVLFVIAGSDETESKSKTPIMAVANRGWQRRLVDLATSRSNRRLAGPLQFDALTRNVKRVPRRLIESAVSNLGGRQDLGLRFDKAHFLFTTPGIGIWVVQGEGLTCIFQAVKMASACSINALVKRKGEMLVVGDSQGSRNARVPTDFLALGIAPDHVKSVLLKPIGSPARSIPVVNNAYAWRAKTPIIFVKLIR